MTSSTHVVESSRWFGADSGAGRRTTLVCFPYAGAGASAFRGWQQVMPDAVGVLPIRLPGRETRIAEPPIVDAVEVAAALVDRVAPPYALYGHSMGARMAFEVVRDLMRRRAPLPTRLFVGGAGAPHQPEPLGRLDTLTDDDLLDELVRLGGAPEELLTSAELRALALPTLRADIRWVAQYRYRPGPALPVPITAFAGVADRDVGPTTMVPWAHHTRAGFRLHTLHGGHFFLDTARDRLSAVIAAEHTGADEPARTPLPDADEVHIWLLDLDLVPEICDAWDDLSPREALRAARYRNDDDRRRFIAQCAALRRVLRRYGADPGRAELPTGPNGKPTSRHPSGIRFNASRSGHHVVIGVTRGTEIGVDIEQIRPMADIDAFTDGAMDAHERSDFDDLPDDQRLSAALHTWTAKEAVLKATGDGLSVDPSGFGFDRRPPGTPWRARTGPGLERLRSWSVTHLPLDDVVTAVALPHGTWRTRFEIPTIDRL